MKFLLILVVVYVCVVGDAKHLHPRSVFQDQDQKIVANDGGDADEMIWSIQHSRFVPANNVLFFTKHPPCDEGFKRDLLGICREVWD